MVAIRIGLSEGNYALVALSQSLSLGLLATLELVNRRDLFELFAADKSTKKSATTHRRTLEAYASGSDIQVFWRDKKEKFQVVQGPAIVVVSPPGMSRRVALRNDLHPSGVY